MQSYSGAFCRRPIEEYHGSEKLILCYYANKLSLYSKYSKSLDQIHIPAEFVFLDEQQGVQVVGKKGKFRIRDNSKEHSKSQSSEPRKERVILYDDLSPDPVESYPVGPSESYPVGPSESYPVGPSDDLPDFIPIASGPSDKPHSHGDIPWKWETLDE